MALFAITLRGRETDRVYGAWSISAGDLPDGWTTFTLGAGVDIDSDTLEVVIELKSGRTLALGLGSAHPVAECAVQTDGGQATRPLAMRVWQGLPSVPPQPLAGVMPAAGAETRRFRLSPRSLASGVVIGVDGKPIKDADDCIRLDELGAVWIQPNGDGTALVLIENACPRHATRVWATFAGASETIELVQVALCAVKTGSGALQSVSRRDLERVTWTDLLSNRPETLVEELGDQDADSANSVLLGVRVDDPAKSWFASTHLVSVEIEYRPESTESVLPTGRP